MSHPDFSQRVKEALKVPEKSIMKILLEGEPIWLEMADWIRDRRGQGREKVRKGDQLRGHSITQA